MKMKIRFMPADKEIFVNKTDNLLNIANHAGVLIDASCGGTKKCGKCKVKILSGATAPLTETETSLLSLFEIENGYRLACCLDIDSDLEVYVPASHGGSTRKKRMTILPEGFVADTFECSSPCYGIAFDIGTTTVVGMLWSLANHTLVDTEARTNYQSVYGADVISRIQFCNQDDSNVTLLQQKIISCFNDILEDLLIRNQILPQQIHDVTIVGNTTMSHLVTGVHPRPLALAPFTPVFLEAPNLSAEELGLHVNPSANVYLLPNIAGHVGSDIVGMMLSTSIYKSSGSHIAIDIGTNGEIVAIKNGRLLTCSTAAGPAFEGACIYHGMRAASGAIEKVVITGGEVQIQTIDNSVPVGLCGSGLIDAVAALLDAGVIEPSGRMLPQDEALEEELPYSLCKRIITYNHLPAFVLTPSDQAEPVLLTQQDVREVQLAKGAILAGIQTLMKMLDMKEHEIDSILLAGAFGNYIDKSSALRMGLLPDISKEKIVSVGNAAGAGASMALLSSEQRDIASRIAKETEHVELSLNMDFQEFYMYAMTFE